MWRRVLTHTKAHTKSYTKAKQVRAHTFEHSNHHRWFSLRPKPRKADARKIDEKTPVENRPLYNTAQTLGEVVSQDYGLSRHIRKTYTKVGLGAGVTVGMAALAPHVDLVMQYPGTCLVGGVITALGSIGVMCYEKCKSKVVTDQQGTLDMEDTMLRKASFWGLVLGEGLTIAPFASVIHEIDPGILPTAALITTGVMAGASLYAYRTPPDQLTLWGTPLYGSLLGLLGVGVVGLGCGLVWGPSSLMFQALHSVNTYGGIVLFSAFTAYDTEQMMDRYQTGDPDHIGSATEFYLNFVNLLVRIMEVLAKFQKK